MVEYSLVIIVFWLPDSKKNYRAEKHINDDLSPCGRGEILDMLGTVPAGPAGVC